MKHIIAAVLLLAMLCSAGARPGPQDAGSIRSVSGLFTAYPSKSPSPSRFYSGNEQSIPLDPALLVISCERIKQGLWSTLGTHAPAKGRILLHLRPSRFAGEQATIVVEKVLTGWSYHVDVPDALPPQAFVRTVVQATLLEMANRGAEDKSAEVPLWLAEGLSQELMATDKTEFLVAPAAMKGNGNLMLNRLVLDGRRQNPIKEAQTILRGSAPLTFEQLSWPSEDQLSGETMDVFRSSAQLFVRQLLHLKDGAACLRATLGEFSRNYNWQFAFLHGFQAHFQSLLDVEKWWALQLVQFTGRDLMQTWTMEQSWNKLDGIVLSPVEVRSSAAKLPRRSEVTLQTVIAEWDAVRQQQTLRRKLLELDLLRPRAAQDLISLVDDYRSLIGTYLKKQNFSGSFFGFKKPAGPIRNRLAEETLRRLDDLEARRAALHPEPQAPIVGAARALSPKAP